MDAVSARAPRCGRLWGLAAVRMIEAVAAEARPLDEIRRRVERAHPGLHSNERHRAAELVYAVVRDMRALDAALGADAPAGFEGARARAAVALLSAGGDAEPVLDPDRPAPGYLAPAAARFDPARRYDHPWRPRLEAVYGTRTHALLDALSLPAPVDVRVNTARTDARTLRERLAAEGVSTVPVAGLDHALRAPARAPLTATRAFAAGLFEVQDASSIAAAVFAAPRNGLRILDLCAGAGGKTLAFAAAAPRARITACDTDPHRLAELRRRAARAGVSVDVRPLRGPRDEPPAGAFDLVFVDAPCTGSGTLRRAPERALYITTDEIDAFAARQRALLERAARATAPGGRLVYATCSLFAEENECVAAAFRAAHPAFVWADAAPPPSGPAGSPESGWRFDPLTTGSDGFFVCAFTRVG